MRKADMAEILLWVSGLALLCALILPLHLTLADQNKDIQSVHREMEALTRKIQSFNPTHFGHSIKGTI